MWTRYKLGLYQESMKTKLERNYELSPMNQRRSNPTGLTTRCSEKCRSIIINFFFLIRVSLPFKRRSMKTHKLKRTRIRYWRYYRSYVYAFLGLKILWWNVITNIFNNIIDLFTFQLENNEHPTREHGSYVGIAELISNDNSLISRKTNASRGKRTVWKISYRDRVTCRAVKN